MVPVIVRPCDWQHSPLGTLEPQDAGVLLRIGADDLDWIARYLAGLGIPFKVLAPAELRTAIRELAERLMGAASAGGPEEPPPRRSAG